ncbi:hypothetical protein IJ732_03025 [bacterium]|nr:hypothetical protein [bacterium]
MKIIIKLLILIILIISPNATIADEDTELRDYQGIELPSGSLIPVISLQDFSTLTHDVGSKVEFICSSDLYLNEINIIPKNTKFYGYISKIHEPIVGTHAAMRIKIVKAEFTDGYEIPFKAYIYSPNGNLIGGGMTEPAKYIQKMSKRQGYAKSVGYVPGPTRKMGEHVEIAAGADLLIVLETPVYITHTVTN